MYDTGPDDAAALTIYWHPGSPQSGAPPQPLLGGAGGRRVRWLSHDRPGYGVSSPRDGRTVAAVAADVAAVADAAGVARFAVMGASGGGPHALACAGVLGDRVLGVAALASVAPFEAAGLDWFAGMGAAGADEFRAAARGRARIEAHLASGAALDDAMFAPADRAAFLGAYGPWLASSVASAMSGKLDGYLDDLLAFVAPWDFDLDAVGAPVLLVQGAQDLYVPSAHAEWLARGIAGSELWLTTDDGHISVFDHGERAVAWLLDRAGNVA